MKRAVVIIFFLVLFLLQIFAHSGKTDSKGGHYDRQNDEYHYHHGYSAHSHFDGSCPYDYEEQEEQADYEEQEDWSLWEGIKLIFSIVFWVVVCGCGGLLLYGLLMTISRIMDKFHKRD